MSENLSRRDFLKLATTLSMSLAMPFKLKQVEKRSLAELNTTWSGEVKKRIETERPEFALTIDDGGYPNTLEKMLNVLKEKGYTATFFLVGRALINCEIKKPDLLSRLSDEGHTIAYHTMTHESLDHMRERDSSWFAKDYDQWIDTIKKILGKTAFKKTVKQKARAPYGAFTPAFLEMCKDKNLTPYGWSSGPDSVNKGQKITKGDIFILHVKENDVEHLEKIEEYTEKQLVPKTITKVEHQKLETKDSQEIEKEVKLIKFLSHKPK